MQSQVQQIGLVGAVAQMLQPGAPS